MRPALVGSAGADSSSLLLLPKLHSDDLDFRRRRVEVLSFGETESAGVSDGGEVGMDVLGGCVARSVAKGGLSAVACMETGPGGIERAKGPKDGVQTGIPGMFRLVRG